VGRNIMPIYGYGQETFLYLNGIGVNRKIQLRDNVELLPAKCSPEPDSIIKVSKSEIDLGIAVIFLKQVNSQLRITAEDPKTLATLAWNSQWDAVLLSALHDCEAVSNLQCDRPAEEFGPECRLDVTNYYLRGISSSIYMINDDEAAWIEQYYDAAWRLLDKEEFRDAVHSLATYRWHSHPRPRIALIWSGIEGLFKIEGELAFRISLYAARFLAADNEAKMKTTFSDVKRLYKQRSAAVHGSTIKGEASKVVDESAQLLKRLIRQCIHNGDLPNIEELAP
jgi:hypothetical protein